MVPFWAGGGGAGAEGAGLFERVSWMLTSSLLFLFEALVTYQSWQMTEEVGITGLVMVQGQSVMVRVVGSVTV